MESIRTTLSEDGRLVLPAALRKALGLQPGEVVLVVEGDTLRIANTRSAVSEAQELVRNRAVQFCGRG